jgi:hypothetical protein
MGGSMKTLIFLIEFYKFPDYLCAEYDEFRDLNVDEALIELKKEYPEAKVLNTYVHTMCMEDV